VLGSPHVGRYRCFHSRCIGSVETDEVHHRGPGGSRTRARGRPVFHRHRFLLEEIEFWRTRSNAVEIESVEALFRGVLNAEGERLGISLTAADTRRNIATSGVPLNHLDREFRVGAVLMRGMRLCEPCNHLEDLTQHGVVSGLIHRGGPRAQILTEGLIRVGDAIHS
jgi:hypothetical protein